MQHARLSNATRFLLFFFLLFGALYYAKSVLVPIAFAGLLSMLLLPLSERWERKGMSRGLAIILSILLLVIIVAGMFVLLGWQISNLTSELAQSEEKIMKMVQQVRHTITEKLGIPPEQQKQLIKQQQASSGGKASAILTTVLSSISGTLVDTVLVLVYMFLFTFYRFRLRNFALKLVPAEEREKAIATMSEARKVAQKYISGLGMMILSLWVMYGIGFSIVGVKNALFFAILCGTLEIVPFVGNITGTTITALMALTQGGGTGMVLGVLAVYGIVQFFQTYILEPLVVGSEVNLNPLFTIIAIVVGEAVWGVPGMILSIPLAGIAKIVFDHVEPLKPYGYLLGDDKKKEPDSNSFKHRVKQWFMKLFDKQQ